MLKKIIRSIKTFNENRVLLANNLKKLNKIISPNDLMYKSDKENYLNWGKMALECVERTLKKVGKTEVSSILDLPCGHGRVLRFLKAAFPEAIITACEIDQDGVDFCVKTFGARGVYSSKNPDEIPIDGKFDLIWCGSLLTHLNQDKWYDFIKFFSKHLEKDGILIFTAHGECIIDYLRKGKENLGLDKNQINKILEDYDLQGFGYINYFGNNSYGISLSSSVWVLNLLKEFPQLKLIEHNSGGWGSSHYHQDSYAFIRKD